MGEESSAASETSEPAFNQASTATPVPPTPTATNTPTQTATATITSTPTISPTTTQTPTETAPPPTPSGEDAIHIYAIQDQTDDPRKCDYIAVKLSTGAWRTGNTASDVKRALRSLFVKRQWFGSLENPAYLSNITVDSVDFKPYTGLVSVNLSGTYVRSGDRCDDSKVRAQVWTTVRQFPEVKKVYILLNGNLLGDILATGK